MRLLDHFDVVEPLENLFLDDLQLQFRQANSDAAMDAETE